MDILQKINPNLVSVHSDNKDSFKTKNSFDKLNNNNTVNNKQSDLRKMRLISEKLQANKELELKDILNINDNMIEKILQRIDELKIIFDYYSSLGDKINTSKIELTSFKKFLKDLELIENFKDHAHAHTMTRNYTELKNFDDRPKSFSPSNKKLDTNTNNNSSIFKFQTNLHNSALLNDSDICLIFSTLTGIYN